MMQWLKVVIPALSYEDLKIYSLYLLDWAGHRKLRQGRTDLLVEHKTRRQGPPEKIICNIMWHFILLTLCQDMLLRPRMGSSFTSDYLVSDFFSLMRIWSVLGGEECGCSPPFLLLCIWSIACNFLRFISTTATSPKLSALWPLQEHKFTFEQVLAFGKFKF